MLHISMFYENTFITFIISSLFIMHQLPVAVFSNRVRSGHQWIERRWIGSSWNIISSSRPLTNFGFIVSSSPVVAEDFLTWRYNMLSKPGIGLIEGASYRLVTLLSVWPREMSYKTRPESGSGKWLGWKKPPPHSWWWAAPWQAESQLRQSV